MECAIWWHYFFETFRFATFLAAFFFGAAFFTAFFFGAAFFAAFFTTFLAAFFFVAICDESLVNKFDRNIFSKERTKMREDFCLTILSLEKNIYTITFRKKIWG